MAVSTEHQHTVQYTHSMTIVMSPGPVLCTGGTKYPHCVVLYCIPTYIYFSNTQLHIHHTQFYTYIYKYQCFNEIIQHNRMISSKCNRITMVKQCKQGCMALPSSNGLESKLQCYFCHLHTTKFMRFMPFSI